MSTLGQKEKKTQERVVALFRDTLGYTYLGNWATRKNNRNIEKALLRAFLHKGGYDEALITRALHVIEQAAGDHSKSIYDRNRAVYGLLRYGVKVRAEVGENTETVWLIDWHDPHRNDFAIAEEVTIPGATTTDATKRPDIVLYVNGIALGVLELKRSTVSVAEGIRQNLDNQKALFIEHFFSTIQFVMAGNDTEGLRHATIQTPEKYYLTWKEPSSEQQPLHRNLTQVCGKARLLELIHDFIVFDAGTKKLCRPNQYFGVRAAQAFIERRDGGIIWHTQGSGKSLTMVWLAKWIYEHVPDARLLIITDRTELDDQIKGVFLGVDEEIYRTTSGADLIATLNATTPWLVCSLVHKFGSKEDDDRDDAAQYIAELQGARPADFVAKGNLIVFVDECHRTQSGDLHKAMKAILPGATFIGFTGTPLLKADKKKSVETFGPYIHTYKFDEAVHDGVVLDLVYEARDIDQHITSQAKIDTWFEAKTKGLTTLARAQLKKRWGTMQKVLSSKSRLENIVQDIFFDMETRPRLMTGRGNAMLVSGSIFQACKFYEMFDQTDLKGKCAIVTSYRPNVSDVKGEESGEGLTERLQQYEIYQKMLNGQDPEAFEKAVKKKFIEEPGQMRLLIVVDKLLTGFDAPSATYLYIDKQMRDHGLFQAICRVNRLDGDDKEYGYIVDYKDLFKSLETSIHDYTAGALDGYDAGDVAGLLDDRLVKARVRLEAAREAIAALCEPVGRPADSLAYSRYFCAEESGNAGQLKENEPKRLTLYQLTAALVRAYANIANELLEAGYTDLEASTLAADVDHYQKACMEVKLASGDYIDLKLYEPSMRHLIDTYIRADESTTVSAFENTTLIELIVERGVGAVDALPPGMKRNKTAVAETIENNVRRLIIDEHAINPKYYDKMSELLDALIEQRKRDALEYQHYLAEIVALAQRAKNPNAGTAYPAALTTAAKRALYDNLGNDEELALAVDLSVLQSRQDAWRESPIKIKMVRNAITKALGKEAARAGEILAIVQSQHDY